MGDVSADIQCRIAVDCDASRCVLIFCANYAASMSSRNLCDSRSVQLLRQVFNTRWRAGIDYHAASLPSKVRVHDLRISI